MTPTQFWYRAETANTPVGGAARCWLCGGACPADAANAQSNIRPTFTDHDRAVCRESDVMCEACVAYLDYKFFREGQKRGMGLYTKSVLVWPDRWQEWERESHADHLLDWFEHGLPADAILALNYSKQKHVIPWAKINPAGTRRPWISTDRGDVRLPDDWPVIVREFAGLWTRGYPKMLLAQGQLGAYQLAKSDDPARDLMALRTFHHYVGSPVIDLVSYVLTEANRDRLAGLAPAILGSAQS